LISGMSFVMCSPEEAQPSYGPLYLRATQKNFDASLLEYCRRRIGPRFFFDRSQASALAADIRTRLPEEAVTILNYVQAVLSTASRGQTVTLPVICSFPPTSLGIKFRLRSKDSLPTL
jgi:hypothetical protein